MASPPSNDVNFPKLPPPPPSHQVPPRPPPKPVTPPPPHVIPPPPPSSPDSDSTVIIVLFMSFGCLFFLAFLLGALCCFIKKSKKKTVQETNITHVDEHLKVKEAIVPDPHEPQLVALPIEDDVHVEEETRKNEKLGEGVHVKSADTNLGALEAGEPSSSSVRQHVEHNS